MAATSFDQALAIQHQFKELKLEQPKIRARNAAEALGISEMELLAAGVDGVQAQPLKGAVQDVFKELGLLGRVMALTRNQWCVHERHGTYEDIRAGNTIGLVLGPDIDLRMFFKHWGMCWAVEDNGRHSLQFFDTAGQAVHKVFCTAETDMESYRQLVQSYATTLESWPVVAPIKKERATNYVVPAEFREKWLAIKDTHEFNSLLKKFDFDRLTVLKSAEADLAQRINNDDVEKIIQKVAAHQIPFMCFVSNGSMVQIHSGPIKRTLRTGEWFNILDPTFNLHLSTGAIAETWVVNRPSEDGWITSVECFDKEGELIVQFFGVRKSGISELIAWRNLVVSYCSLPLAS